MNSSNSRHLEAILKQDYIFPQTIDSLPQEGIANKVKTFLKKKPELYIFIQHFFAPAFSPFLAWPVKKVIASCFSEEEIQKKVVVNLGSGTTRIHLNVINVDLYPFKNVDVAADIEAIPFIDESCDMVIIDSVLEHVAHPEKVITEIKRILKSGGYVYVTVPFLYPFHSSPNDYYRWTKEGVNLAFADFVTVRDGIQGGPMAALQGILMHALALLFSFGSSTLYFFLTQLFMILLSPLKILDILFIPFSHTHEVGTDLYFLGQKK